MYAKIVCDRIIIRTDTGRQIIIKLKTCMYLAEPMSCLYFRVMRSKVTGFIMYAKIACERIIIGTDRQSTIKLKTGMYLAEPMSCLDFRGHEGKGHGAHYVQYVNVLSLELMDGLLLDSGHLCILQSQ